MTRAGLALVSLSIACGGATATRAPVPADPAPAPPASAAAPAVAVAPDPEPEERVPSLALTPCERTRDAGECASIAARAIDAGDIAMALHAAHLACQPGGRCTGDSRPPRHGSAEALALGGRIASACAEGWEPACTMRPLGAALLADAQASCEASRTGACDALALFHLHGFGTARDVVAAAAVAAHASYPVRLAILEAGGTLPPAALPAPAPSVSSAMVAVDGFGRVEGGVSVGYDGRRSYHAVGLPGISADGRLVAIVSSTGDGTSDEIALVSLATDGRSPGRRDPLSESQAADEETPAEAEQQRLARTQILRAGRYLERRGFRSIVRLGDPREPETLRDGVPILEWSSDGWVTIRDPGPGRVRFRERLVVPGPGPPDDLTEEQLEEWEMEHRCDIPGLEQASAWLVDAEHVLLETSVNPSPDECTTSDDHRVVTLAP